MSSSLHWKSVAFSNSADVAVIPKEYTLLGGAARLVPRVVALSRLAHERAEGIEVPSHPVPGKLAVPGLDSRRDPLVGPQDLGLDLLAGRGREPLDLVDQAQPDEDEGHQFQYAVARRRGDGRVQVVHHVRLLLAGGLRLAVERLLDRHYAVGVDPGGCQAGDRDPDA